MTASGITTTSTVGFLTVCEHRDLGLFGGLLLLNSAGRPLEFHCTAPVKPNRAQEILYGPTLEPYLFGEQIAQTLISKAKSPPAAVFTDRAPVLAARELCDVPLACIDLSPADSARSDSVLRVDEPHRSGPPAPFADEAFMVGRHRLSIPHGWTTDRQAIERCCQSLSPDFDLAEPFGRIRDAIQEAQRTALAPRPTPATS